MAIEIPAKCDIMNDCEGSLGPGGKKNKLYNDLKYSFDYVVPADEMDPLLFFEADDEIDAGFGTETDNIGDDDNYNNIDTLLLAASKANGTVKRTQFTNLSRPSSAGAASSRRRSGTIASSAASNHPNPNLGLNTQRPVMSASGRSRGRGHASTSHSFSVQGIKCSVGHIAFIDSCCEALEKADLLQRWARRVLERTRRYHAHRRAAALVLQCSYRVWSARQLKKSIVRCNKAIIIQCLVRRFLSIRKRLFLLHTKCAIILQCRIRCWLAMRLKHWLGCLVCGAVLWRWYRQRVDVRHRKAAFKIVR